MKTIPKITGLLVAVLCLQLFVPEPLFSQAAQSRSTSFIDAHLSKIKQEITLTNDQEQGIRKILETLYLKRKQAQKQNSLNKEIVLEKRSAQIHYLHQLDSILSEEQKHTLSAKIEQRISNSQDKLNFKIR